MKAYKEIPEEEQNTLQEPVAAYGVAQANAVHEFKIPRDEHGKPIGHTLDEFSEKLLDKLSEIYGVDFRTL
ncbi:hypothetical protein [Viscerimonas tarda]